MSSTLSETITKTIYREHKTKNQSSDVTTLKSTLKIQNRCADTELAGYKG